MIFQLMANCKNMQSTHSQRYALKDKRIVCACLNIRKEVYLQKCAYLQSYVSKDNTNVFIVSTFENSIFKYFLKAFFYEDIKCMYCNVYDLWRKNVKTIQQTRISFNIRSFSLFLLISHILIRSCQSNSVLYYFLFLADKPSNHKDGYGYQLFSDFTQI